MAVGRAAAAMEHPMKARRDARIFPSMYLKFLT
jgi:hypothetical protein